MLRKDNTTKYIDHLKTHLSDENAQTSFMQ